MSVDQIKKDWAKANKSTSVEDQIRKDWEKSRGVTTEKVATPFVAPTVVAPQNQPQSPTPQRLRPTAPSDMGAQTTAPIGMTAQQRLAEEKKNYDKRMREIEAQMRASTDRDTPAGMVQYNRVDALQKEKAAMLKNPPDINTVRGKVLKEDALNRLTVDPNDDNAWLQFISQSTDPETLKMFQTNPQVKDAVKAQYMSEVNREKIYKNIQGALDGAGIKDQNIRTVLTAFANFWTGTEATANTIGGLVNKMNAPGGTAKLGEHAESMGIRGPGTSEDLLAKGAEGFTQQGYTRERQVGTDATKQFIFDVAQAVPDMLVSIGLGALGASGKAAAKMTATEVLKGFLKKESREASIKALAKAMVVRPEMLPMGTKIFAQSFQQNKEEGMDDAKALFVAFINAYGQSLLEGGGAQEALREGNIGKLTDIVKAAFGEGVEEIQQGYWEQAVRALVGGVKMPLYSSDMNEDAFINPGRDVYSMAVGMGAGLGGGVTALPSMAKTFVDEKTQAKPVYPDAVALTEKYNKDLAQYEEEKAIYDSKQPAPEADPKDFTYTKAELRQGASPIMDTLVEMETRRLEEKALNASDMKAWEEAQNELEALSPEVVMKQVSSKTADPEVMVMVEKKALELNPQKIKPVTNPMAKLAALQKQEAPVKPSAPDLGPQVDTSKMSPMVVKMMEKDMASVDVQAITELAVQGKTSKQIAQELGIPARAVRSTFALKGIPSPKSEVFGYWRATQLIGQQDADERAELEKPLAERLITPEAAQTRIENVRVLKEAGVQASKDLGIGETQTVKLGKALGVDVIFYEGVGKDSTTRGLYSTKEGRTIFINRAEATSGTTALNILGHEFLHNVSENHKDLYQTLRDVIGDTMTTEKVQKQLDKYKLDKDYQARLSKDKELLIEEILADEAGTLFTDKAFWEAVAKKNETAAQKLIRLFRQLINRVLKMDSENLDVMTELQIKDFRTKFEDAVAEIMRGKEVAAGEPGLPTDAPKLSVVKGSNLVALHNITEAKLANAIRLGGFPAPSIAVTKETIPFTNFGEITLVGKSDLVDPSATKTNKIFNTDIYSKRIPQLLAKVNKKAVSAIEKELKKGYDLVDDYLYSATQALQDGNKSNAFRDIERRPGTKAAFLLERGETVNVPRTWSLNVVSPEAARTFLEENPTFSVQEYYKDEEGWATKFDKVILDTLGDRIDEAGKQEILESMKRTNGTFTLQSRDKIMQDIMKVKQNEMSVDMKAVREDIELKLSSLKDQVAYSDWVHELIEPAFGDEYFSVWGDGRERKIPFDINKLFNYMKGDIKASENSWSSSKMAKARGAKQYRSLSALRKDASLLVPEQEARDYYKQFETEDAKVLQALLPYSPYKYAADQYYEAMGEFLSGVKAERALANNEFNGVPEELVADFVAVSQMLIDSPVSYFEAKPQRIVRLDEFAAAVVSETVGYSTINSLEREGLKILKYESYSDESWLKAVEDTRDMGTRFSVKKPWAEPQQEISSADTSINQNKLPTTFTKMTFKPGTVNADIGGGRFDNATEFLAEKGVKNYIYDPFNRTLEQNQKAIAAIKDGQADTVTVNNVLNVIQEQGAREQVIINAHNAMKGEGTAYFKIYEGNGTGVGTATSKGYQNNMRAEGYINEIAGYFGDIKRTGDIIVAKLPKIPEHSIPSPHIDPRSSEEKLSVAKVTGMYSKLYKHIEEKMPNSMPGSAVVDFIRGGQIKKEEMEYFTDLGFEGFAESERVTKQEVLDYLTEMALELNVITRGDFEGDKDKLAALEKLVSEARANDDARRDARNEARRAKEDAHRAVRALDDKDLVESNPVWIAFQEAAKRLDETEKAFSSSREYLVSLEKAQKEMRSPSDEAPKWEDYTLKGPKTNYIEKMFQYVDFHVPQTQAADFHWPGREKIFSHIRMDDRVDAAGKKVLFIEEIQSDVLNAEKAENKEGGSLFYREIEDTRAELDLQITTLETDIGSLSDKGRALKRLSLALDHNLPESEPLYQKYQSELKVIAKEIREKASLVDSLSTEYHSLARRIDKNKNKSQVPPLLQNHFEFSLKQILKYAAEGDYERIAWTTGLQQAQRYKMSNYASTVNWFPEKEGKGRLVVEGKDGGDLYDKVISEVNVKDVIGKELAAKLLESPLHMLSGNGLDIGEPGKHSFYDTMVPAFLKKYIKAPQEEVLIGRDLSDTKPFREGGMAAVVEIAKKHEKEELYNVQPSIVFTEEMRKNILEKGQPLFSVKKEEPTGEPSVKAVMDKQKPPVEFKTRIAEANEWFERLYTKLFSKTRPISRADAATGVIASNTSVVSGTVDYILTKALVDKNGDYVGKSWKDVTAPFVDNQAFWDYLIQKHNIDRFREGKPVDPNMSSEHSAAYVAEAEKANPEFKTWSEDVANWTKTFMKTWGVDTGMLDVDVFNEWNEMYPFYFPTYRDFEEDDSSFGPGKRFVNLPSVSKKATGSDKDVTNSVGNVMLMVNKIVRTARYNQVGQSMATFAENNPDNPYVRLLEPNQGMFLRKKPDNLVMVWDDGVPLFMEILNKDLLDAMNNMPKIINNHMGFRKFNNLFKGLITHYNPLFAIRNATRDVVTAYVYGNQHNPLMFGANLLRAYYDYGANTERAQKYKALGGGSGGLLSADEATEYAKMLRPSAASFLKVPLKAIEWLNQLTEQAPRLSEFNYVLEKTGDVQKALHASQDVTVNFARGGIEIKQMEPFVPYLNASVQGIDRFFRAFIPVDNPNGLKGKERLMESFRIALPRMAKAGFAVSGLQIASYIMSMMDDEEKYKSLDQRTKDSSYVFPLKDGTYLKIPKARELGVLFGTLLERALIKNFEGYGQAVLTNFTPVNPLTNNIFSPIGFNLYANKDFAGRTIVPQSLQGMSPENQWDSNTSEIAKEIGKRTGLSPKQIDYVVDAYTGIIGDILLPATTKRAGAGNAIKRVVVNPFIADPTFSSQSLTSFYDKLDELVLAKNDKNKNVDSKIVTPEEKAYSAMNKISSQISKATKYINANLKSDDKKVEDIKDTINRHINKALTAKSTAEVLKVKYQLEVSLYKLGVR